MVIKEHWQNLHPTDNGINITNYLAVKNQQNSILIIQKCPQNLVSVLD